MDEKVDYLIDFLIYMEEKGIINDYDFDYEEVSKGFINNRIAMNKIDIIIRKTPLSLDEATELHKYVSDIDTFYKYAKLSNLGVDIRIIINAVKLNISPVAMEALFTYKPTPH